MVMLMYLPLFMLFATANGLCRQSPLCCNTTTDMTSYKQNDTINVTFNCIDISSRLLYDVSPRGPTRALDYYVRIVPINTEYDPYEIGTQILHLPIPVWNPPKEVGANASVFANESYEYGQYKVFLSEIDNIYLYGTNTTLVGISKPFKIQSPFSCNTTTDKKLYKRSETIYVSFSCVNSSAMSLLDYKHIFDYVVSIISSNVTNYTDPLMPYLAQATILSQDLYNTQSAIFGGNTSFFVGQNYTSGEYKVLISEKINDMLDNRCTSEFFEIMGQKRTTFLGRMLDRVVSFWNWLRSLFGK